MKVSDYQDIGAFLRDSRESLRITCEQAGKELHIRPKYLRALESGNLGELPGKAYIRGYIKNYAEYLGANPDEVLDAYEGLALNKAQDYFVPELTQKQHLPSKNIIKASLGGLVLLYIFWFFAYYDATPIEVQIIDVPEKYRKLLGPSIYQGMAEPWKACLENGELPCFWALREDAVAVYTPEIYDIDLTTFPPYQR